MKNRSGASFNFTYFYVYNMLENGVKPSSVQNRKCPVILGGIINMNYESILLVAVSAT